MEREGTPARLYTRNAADLVGLVGLVGLEQLIDVVAFVAPTPAVDP